MTHSARPTPMKYELNSTENKKKLSTWEALLGLWPMLEGEHSILVYAALATLANSAVSLTAPLLIAHVVDTYIVAKNFSGVLTYAFILLGLYLFGLLTSYAQTRLMGGTGQ